MIVAAALIMSSVPILDAVGGTQTVLRRGSEPSHGEPRSYRVNWA